jgi:hypothetical protein
VRDVIFGHFVGVNEDRLPFSYVQTNITKRKWKIKTIRTGAKPL